MSKSPTPTIMSPTKSNFTWGNSGNGNGNGMGNRSPSFSKVSSVKESARSRMNDFYTKTVKAKEQQRQTQRERKVQNIIVASA